MTEERQAVRVNIFGSEYTIRGEADGEYIQELAHYVDSKLQEVANGTGLNIPLKVSILAAINMADEVFRLRAAVKEKPAPEPVQTSFPTEPGAPVPTAEPVTLAQPIAAEIPAIATEAVADLARRIEEALKE